MFIFCVKQLLNLVHNSETTHSNVYINVSVF